MRPQNLSPSNASSPLPISLPTSALLTRLSPTSAHHARPSSTMNTSTISSRKGEIVKDSTHLHSLSKLNSLKANTSLHGLNYNQLRQLIPSDKKYSDPKKPKRYGGSVILSNSLKSSYMSLNPEFLKDDVPKKKFKHALPSEQRQILIDKYISQEEMKLNRRSMSTIQDIWHQTLIHPTSPEATSVKSPLTSNRSLFFSPNKDAKRLLSGLGSPDKDPIKNFTDSSYVLSSPLARDKQFQTSMMDQTTLSIGRGHAEGDDLYYKTTKQMEMLVTSLKDFHKLISYTQNTYQRTKVQQTHLSNFVLTFIKEIDDIERIPKSLNLARLNLCLSSLEGKAGELETEKELILEQIERINDLVEKKETNKDALWQSSRKGRWITPHTIETGHHAHNSSQSSALMGHSSKVGSALLEHAGSHIPCISDGYSSMKDVNVMDHLQLKAYDLRSDVKKLQHERVKFHEIMRSQRPGASRATSPKLANFFDTSEVQSQNRLSATAGEGESLIGERLSPTNMMQLNEPTPRYDEEDVRGSRKLTWADATEDRSQAGKKITQVPVSPDPHCAMMLYELYEQALVRVEQEIMKRLNGMDVFKKDVDEEGEFDNKLLSEQIADCFEVLNNELPELTKDLQVRERKFLEEIARNYENFKSLSSSNFLKLTSVRNIVKASIDKMVKLEKICTMYSSLELTDTMIRQQHDTAYKALKQDLKKDRKTLLFLTEQFDYSAAIYSVDMIKEPAAQKVAKLNERSRMLLRVLYNIEKFPLLEDEFNEKTTTAYQRCKVASDLIASLQGLEAKQENLSAVKYTEAEEFIKQMESLHIRIVALQNDMKIISKLEILESTAAKPLLVVIKLEKKIIANQRELKELLNRGKEALVNDYNKVVKDSEDIEVQINSHIRRLAEDQEHLSFPLWRQNFYTIGAIKAEVDLLLTRILSSSEQKFPSSVVFVPRPQEKKAGIEYLEYLCDGLLKLIKTGKLFEEWYTKGMFPSLKTSNIKKKLDRAFQNISDEMTEKENVAAGLKPGSELLKRLVIDVLRVLSQLKIIFSRTFELEERVNRDYSDFQEEHLANGLGLLNPTVLLEKHLERYPKLVTAKSMDKYEAVGNSTRDENYTSIIFKADPEGSADSPAARTNKTFKRQVTMGLVRSLPAVENVEDQYPNKMNGFIKKLQQTFDSYFENVLLPYIELHSIFKDVYERFKDMSVEEIKILEQCQIAVHNIQVNHIFYNQEVRPLTQVYKYVMMLNNWNSKVEALKGVQNTMKSCLQAIEVLDGEPTLRGGIELQVIKYKQIQEMVGNSVNIIIDLLSLGHNLNEKRLHLQLGPSLRIEEDSITEFVMIHEDGFTSVCQKFRTNSDLLEEGTEHLFDRLQDFSNEFNNLLKIAQQRYQTIFRIVSEGLSPFEGDLMKYVETLSTQMKDFADNFCDKLNEVSRLVQKPTWLVRALDIFYRDIVLKDLKMFSRLHEETKRLTSFIHEFEVDFIDRKIKKEATYKLIDSSDPTYCDIFIERCNKIFKSLNEFSTAEEIVCRPELKSLISLKLKELQNIKKVMVVFSVVFSMGKKLNDNVQFLEQKVRTPELYEILVDLDISIRDILNHLSRSVDDAKALDREYCNRVLSLRLEDILRNHVVLFYSECRIYFNKINEDVSGMAEFFHELKRKYKNQVMLLRDDWVAFIREYAGQYFVNLEKRISPIDVNYPQFKERLQAFLHELNMRVRTKKHNLMDTARRIEYLNENFFNEWFFNFLHEEKDVGGDKLLPIVKKLIRDIRNQKFKEDEKLKQKIHKTRVLVEKCETNIKELSNKNTLKGLFDDLDKWNEVQEYFTRKNIGVWKPLFDVVEAQVIGPEKNLKLRAEFKEKVKDLSGLCTYLEQELSTNLTDLQKEFVEVVYAQIYGQDQLEVNL